MVVLLLTTDTLGVTPDQQVSRSGSVETPISTLPYLLLPLTSNVSGGLAPDPEPLSSTVPAIPDPHPPEKQDPHKLSPLAEPSDLEVTTPAPAAVTTEADKKWISRLHSHGLTMQS